MSDKYVFVCKDTLIMRLEEAEAQRDALQKAILQFKENPISKNKFKMFDLIEGAE